MKKKDIREKALLEALYEKKELTVKEVTEMLNISEATARRMFAELELQNKLIRSFGSIRYIDFSSGYNSFNYEFENLKSKKWDEKLRIGKAAAEHVDSGEIIYVSGGTTTHAFSLALAERIKSNDLVNVTVITNSLVNLQDLSGLCNLVLIGGNHRPRRLDFCGYVAEQTIKNMRFAKCFLGVDGIDTEFGLMAIEMETAKMDEMILERSQKRFILATSEKFEKRNFIGYASLSMVNCIITDSDLPKPMLSQVAAFDIAIERA